MSGKFSSILMMIAVALILGAGAGIIKASPGTCSDPSFKLIQYTDPINHDAAWTKSQKLLTRDLEADAPSYSQDKDPTCDVSGEDASAFPKDRDVALSCIDEAYPSGYGYGNIGGAS